jgi:uncharacterized membrane protein
MNDKLDKAIRSCFADRRRPPDEVRAALHKKLLTANRRRETIRDWVVMAYTLIFSAALTVAAWMLTGSNAVLYFCLAGLFLSAVCGVAITIVCQKEHDKGGVADVTVCD